MAEHTHWKTAFPSDYFGHQHMPADGSDLLVEIKDAAVEMVRGPGGRGQEEKLVLQITADPSKWILNKTNAKTIEKVTGEKYIDGWIGKKLRLYVTKTSSPEGLVDCVRVRDFAPQE